jgi:hypothetical protein
MSDKDFLEERFEVREAMQLCTMGIDCMGHFLKDARGHADAGEWQDCLVSMRLARECISDVPECIKRLDASILMLTEKIEKEKI